MFKTIEGATDCEILSVISFLSARNELPSEIHHQICQVYGDNGMSNGIVRKWVRMFNEVRENVHDEARSGRPSLVNDDFVRKVNERVRGDRRFTISDLSVHFPQISRTLLCDTVDSHLGYRKVCARWVVPKMVTEENKNQRVACALKFLVRYHREGDGRFSHIVTGDETWVSHITPESKQQSLHWKHTGLPKTKSSSRLLNKEDHVHRILGQPRCCLGLFLPQGTTINSAVYCETLKRLRRAIQNKRRGMLSATILLLHDNAQPHSAAQTHDLITSFKWEQMDPPPRTALI